ncbi:MAG TPA: ATP-binding cassette domain-containing protein [Candidatus Binatus sp.]|nr:ATP-binding cassette domain-containing protein [Candidatus Binatus sp.]
MILQEERAGPPRPEEDVAIRLDRVGLRYDEKIVLSDCSVDCKRGHVTGVIGLSGAGKSTILRVINGLRLPDAGAVYINGADITNWSERELIEMRKKMGFAFQYSALFDSMTIAENVAYPLWEHTEMTKAQIDKRVSETLEALGLSEVEGNLPGELSGGMQKRAGFARAIVNDPEIILFDEPTSGLDPIMTHIIVTTIKDIQARLKATSVVVSHDLRSIYALSDTVAMLFEGTIIESGTVNEIRRSPNPIVQQFLQGSELGPIPL